MKSRFFMAIFIAMALLLAACSKDDDGQKPAPEPEEQTEEIPELGEEEAVEILQVYEETFRNIIENAEEDGELTDFHSWEELHQEFLTIMSEALAEDIEDTYFEENEEGSIYIATPEEPVWFDEEETYAFEKVENNLYKLEQEQTDQMLIVTYTIFWDEEKWIVANVELEDLAAEESNALNAEADTNTDQTEQENNPDTETTAETDETMDEHLSDDTDANTAEEDVQANDSEGNDPNQSGTNSNNNGTSNGTDADSSEESQNLESVENEGENSEEASSIDESTAENLVKAHLNIIDDNSLQAVASHQDEDGNFVVQVFELVDQEDDIAHTATYGWYTVDKDTGEVKETQF
ncbi:hypothetical protein [Oceanobacillus sp. CFH 90083]|uniref:hypothetical protein n=1 Tax=Oceanobacillus sp. CFH 90083 TaxID=2592336 RepID=UPI00128D66CC|nr:hypothetical protein [Oceanobacillus sp. CFH 90083]